MAPLVKLALALLRAASHAALFLEAQRLAAHLLRPTSPAHLAAAEAAVLSSVHTPLLTTHTPAPHALRTLATPPCARPPLVLLHGHSMSAAFYFRNFDDLALTHRVYAPDLLGWGRSARPRPTTRTPTAALDFYVSSLASWAAHHGLAAFALLGHSLGAYIAFEYAKRHPAQVTRLILISPAAIMRALPLPRALYFALPPQAIVRRGGLLGYLLFMLYFPHEPAYAGPHRLREYAYHLAAQGPPSGETAVRPMIRISASRPPASRRFPPALPLPLPRASVAHPLIEALDPVPCPVLLVCGETDSSMDIGDVHALHREMKRRGFDVALRVVAGADHCPHIELPDEFYAAVRPFLATKSGKADAHVPPPPRAGSSISLARDAATCDEDLGGVVGATAAPACDAAAAPGLPAL